MAYCVHCGFQIGDNVAVCPNCGKPAAQPDAAGAAAAPATGYTSSAASTGLEENIAGMLAYFTIIPAIIFLLIEPYNRNRFVRFHSFQCLFGVVAVIVIDIILSIFTSMLHLVPMLGWAVGTLIWGLWSLALVALWLLLVIKAYQHQIFKLPVIGDMAERQAGA